MMSSILKYIFNKPNSSPAALNNSSNHGQDNDPTIRETLVGHSSTSNINEEGTSVTTLPHHMSRHDLNTSIQDIDLLVESTSIKIREMEEAETFIAVRVRAYKKQLQSFKERYSIPNNNNNHDDDDDVEGEELGHLNNHPNNSSFIGKNREEFIENPTYENNSSSSTTTLSFMTKEQKDKYEFYQESINEIIEKERNIITEIHRLKTKLQDLESRRNIILDQKDEHDKLVIASVIEDAIRDEEVGLRDRLEANALR